MKVFYLTTSSKDIISKVTAENLEQAVIYFSKVKDLSIDDLLKIYNVIEQ